MKPLLSFPFRMAPLLLVAIFTIGLMIALAAGLFGIALGFILVSWFFKYCFVLLDAMVAGENEPPVLSMEMVNPVGEQRPGVAAVLISAGFWLAWSANHFAGSLSGMLVAALLLMALPASLAVLGVTGNGLKAAWPGAWIALIRGMGRDYLWLAAAVLASGASIYALWHLGVSLWVTFAATQLLLLFAFTLIGGVVHVHRHELDVATLSPAEHRAARDERDFSRERREVLDRSYALLRIGKAAESWNAISTWIETHGARGENLQEYHVVLQAMSAWGDPRVADRLAEDYLGLLLAKRETGEALAVCERCFSSSPGFTTAHAARLAELAGMAGKRALKRQLETASATIRQTRIPETGP